jgi:hypothetical protein
MDLCEFETSLVYGSSSKAIERNLVLFFCGGGGGRSVNNPSFLYNFFSVLFTRVNTEQSPSLGTER